MGIYVVRYLFCLHLLSFWGPGAISSVQSAFASAQGGLFYFIFNRFETNLSGVSLVEVLGNGKCFTEL